jgi:hypothetical protein
LISILVTLLPTIVALVIKPALVKTLTTHLKEEESVAGTVVVNQVALDIKPLTDIIEITMASARVRLKREEDRVIGRVGGGELR